MADDELPDWTTDMDREILRTLARLRVLTPAVIADNIDRSREAVSRRLNTLEAGGLVKKVERGKYSITFDGLFPFMEKLELSEEDQKEVARERDEEIEYYREKYGTTKEEFESAVIEEFQRLRGEKSGYIPFDDLHEEAVQNVIESFESE